jgi:ABC-type multidrug transport system fused ATPase/permease subunit
MQEALLVNYLKIFKFLVIGYIISLWTVITGSSLNLTLFEFPKPMPILLLFYPSFNISRIFYYLTINCGYESCISSLHDPKINSELKTCMIVLYISAVIYIFLGIYLYEVLPQQFGIRKHPLFFLKNCLKKNKRIRTKSIDTAAHETIPINSADDEVVEEQKKVKNVSKEDKKTYPLIVDNLTKIYEDPSGKKGRSKKALSGVNLVLNKNEIFGLLGPNGAGKTTFFSLLTGIFEPTEGNAWVGGHSIKEKIFKVQELIGYCPQFDLLWEDLSVEEHLYFYSRLKNVESNLSRTVIIILIFKYFRTLKIF